MLNKVLIIGNLISGRTYHDNGKYLGAWIKLLKEEREKSRAAAPPSAAPAEAVAS